MWVRYRSHGGALITTCMVSRTASAEFSKGSLVRKTRPIFQPCGDVFNQEDNEQQKALRLFYYYIFFPCSYCCLFFLPRYYQSLGVYFFATISCKIFQVRLTFMGFSFLFLFSVCFVFLHFVRLQPQISF